MSIKTKSSPPTRKKTPGQILSAVSFYWVVSITLVFLNKFMMSGTTSDTHLDAPLFLTWTQLVIAVICLHILMNLRDSFELLSFFPVIKFDVGLSKRLVPLTVIFLGMIIFNNLCLKYVDVSFYQVARSLTVVFNIILSYFVLGKKTSQKCLFAVGIVIGGYLLGVEGEIQISVSGVVFGVMSSLFVALYAINVKKGLNLVGNNAWILMEYNNVNAVFLMPVAILLAGELPELLSNPIMATGKFWLMVLGTGIFGFLINFASFAQIQATSPLTHNISGTAKAGAQTGLALWWFQNPVTTKGMLGIVTVLGGSLLYAYYRNTEMKEPAKATSAASKQDDLELEEQRLVNRSESGKEA